MTEDVFKGTLNRIPIKKAAEILVNTAKEIAEPTKNLLGLAQQLGLTVEQIQTLHSVFVEAGGSTNEFVAGLKNFKGELEKLSLGKGELAKSLLAAGKSPNALANKPPYEALQGLQDLTKDMSYAQTSRARDAAFGQYNQGFEQLLKSDLGEPSPAMISQQDYDQWQQDDKVIDSFWDRIVDGLENIEVVKAMSNGMAKAWSHVNREIANEITDFTLTFGDGEDKARAVQEFPQHLLDRKLGTIKTLHNGGQNYYGDLIPILEELKANGYSDNARRTAAIKIRLNEQQDILNDADSQSQRDMASERIKQLGQDLDSLKANSLQNIQSSAPTRPEEAPSLMDAHAPQQGQGDQMLTLMAKMNETLERLSTKLDEAEEKRKEGAPASVKESPHQQVYQAALKDDEERERGVTLLKAFFDELAPVTEQFGKLKEILSSLLSPEDMAALEAKTQEVAAKEGDATAQDFNGLIEMLKQLLEKVNVILDPETGLLSPKEGSAPIVAPATGSGGGSTGDGTSKAQETQKKGEGIEAQLEAWDEIVRKFGENAVGAFQNMLESGEISIKGLTKMLVQMAKKALIMQVIPRLFGFNSFGTEAGGMFNGLFGKETGGRVSVGMPYLVGEKRPEIFIPDSPGVIAARIGGTGAKVAGAGNQAQVTQNINFTTDVANSVRAEVYNATPHIVAAAHQAVFDTLKGNRRY